MLRFRPYPGPSSPAADGDSKHGVVTILTRASLLLVAYSATVVASLTIGSQLWPTGIGNEAEIIFWPATGVALFFVLRFGPGYAPVIVLSILPAVLLADDPQPQAILGALGNDLEVLIGWWVLTRLGRFSGHFESTRVIAALAAASVLGGIASALYPIHQFVSGEATGETWQATVLRFAFANGCGTMIVCVFLNSLVTGRWRFRGRRKEFTAWLFTSLVVVGFAFNAVFRAEINYAFLVYPLVIFAAIRYGTSECALALVLVVLGIYIALTRYGAQMDEGEVLPIIQFIQAFTWVLAVTGLFVAGLVTERRNAEAEILQKQSLLFESELCRERARLEALRYQMNPHFLFNSINSVCATLPGDSGTGRTMLAELSDYLRSVMEHPADDLSTINQEFDSISKYVAIEQQRFGEDLDIELTAEPGLLEKTIPVFSLQPLVENAIRHGFSSTNKRVDIKVIARTTSDGQVALEVWNNGTWIEHPDREGLGLTNLQHRLEILYGGGASIEQHQNDGMVCVCIVLPIDAPAC